MNAILQEPFKRVETALNSLVDSISAYNPSPSAASALIEADDELTKGLEQLATHQSNHARLVHLRQTSAALSDQITQVLTLLANTRAEVLSTPATTFPKDSSRDVPYDELLTYAKKISKFTVPPTVRRRSPAPQAQAQSTSSPQDDNDEQKRLLGEEYQAQDEPLRGGTTPGEAAEDKDVVVSSRPAEEAQRLGPAAGLGFTPWPADDIIRRGALARIQGMLDAGEDPGAVAGPRGDHDESGREEKQAQGQEEGRQLSTTSKSVDREMSGRSESVHVKEEKPAVFGGLDLYDPDED